MKPAGDVDEEDERGGEQGGDADVERMARGDRHINQRADRRQEAEQNRLAQQHVRHGRDRQHDQQGRALVEHEGVAAAGSAGLQREEGPADAHRGLAGKQQAAPLDQVGGGQVMACSALDEEDVERVDGERRQRPEEKRRIGIDVGAESADHEDDDRHHGRTLQGGADMHAEHLALEQHRPGLVRLQAFARRPDRLRHSRVAMAAGEVDDVLVSRGWDAFTHIRMVTCRGSGEISGKFLRRCCRKGFVCHDCQGFVVEMGRNVKRTWRVLRDAVVGLFDAFPRASDCRQAGERQSADRRRAFHRGRRRYADAGGGHGSGWRGSTRRRSGRVAVRQKRRPPAAKSQSEGLQYGWRGAISPAAAVSATATTAFWFAAGQARPT